MNLEKLVLDYKNVSEESFDRIYQETLPLVKSALLNYITDRKIVMDLIQDTYLTLVEKKDSYNAKCFTACFVECFLVYDIIKLERWKIFGSSIWNYLLNASSNYKFI